MITEQWEYRPDWLDYVKSVWTGAGRVQLVSDDSEERKLFHKLATEAFNRHGVPTKHVKTYVSIQECESGEGYAVQFPHTHYPLTGTSLIHYLQAGDVPAPLDIFSGVEKAGEVIQTIYPKPGLTVFVPHTTWHGVRKNNGTINRIQLIASAV